MVRKKDEVAQHRDRLKDFLRKEAERIESQTIAFKWAVIEHTPAYNTGGYYDQDIAAKNVVVSPYFDSKDEAVSWMNEHEPDNGNKLLIWRKRLIRRVVEEWRWG